MAEGGFSQCGSNLTFQLCSLLCLPSSHTGPCWFPKLGSYLENCYLLFRTQSVPPLPSGLIRGGPLCCSAQFPSIQLGGRNRIQQSSLAWPHLGLWTVLSTHQPSFRCPLPLLASHTYTPNCSLLSFLCNANRPMNTDVRWSPFLTLVSIPQTNPDTYGFILRVIWGIPLFPGHRPQKISSSAPYQPTGGSELYQQVWPFQI